MNKLTDTKKKRAWAWQLSPRRQAFFEKMVARWPQKGPVPAGGSHRPGLEGGGMEDDGRFWVDLSRTYTSAVRFKTLLADRTASHRETAALQLWRRKGTANQVNAKIHWKMKWMRPLWLSLIHI